jgi:hypothetical protein
MTKPIELLTERQAAQQAMIDLENGRNDAALDILRRALSRRTPPPPGRPDRRSTPILRLRAHIERALKEIEHAYIPAAIRTLRRGL